MIQYGCIILLLKEYFNPIFTEMRPEKNAFLEKHLRFFIEYNSYMLVYFGILYWHLDDVIVLQRVLSSEIIKKDKDPIEVTEEGYKIFYQLYKHLRLVKSEIIQTWLKITFPEMEDQFEQDHSPFLLACIDSNLKKVKAYALKEYQNLEEVTTKI